MIKLNRSTEYGLIALRHMSRKRVTDPGDVTSAREISDFYGLPFEVMAKTLQRLKDSGMIESEQGARGGYTLLRALEQVSLAEYLDMMEGPQAVVSCVQHGGCDYHARCEVRGVMSDLNDRVRGFLSGIRLSDLAATSEPGERILQTGS